MLDIYEALDITKAVVFANSRRKVMWLAERLNEENFTVSAIVSKHKALSPIIRHHASLAAM